MRRLVLLLHVAVATIVPATAEAFQRERIVVTFDNRAPDLVATSDANVAMVSALRGRGYDVVSGEKVDAFLREQGLQKLSRVPTDRLARLVQQFRVPTIMEVTIEFLLPPAKRKLGPEAQPIIGISGLRYDAGGRVIWRATTTVVGDEVRIRSKGKEPPPTLTRVMLGAGCDKLLWSLPGAAPDPELVRLAQAQRAKERKKIDAPVSTNVPPRIQTLLEHRPDFRTGPKFRLKLMRRGPVPAEGERFPPNPGALRTPTEPEPAPTAAAPPPEPGLEPRSEVAPEPGSGPRPSITTDLVPGTSSGRMASPPPQ